jgi:hypothetical protein
MSDITRRCRIDLFTPAEQAIREAALAVEAAGCDVRLTTAVMLLGDARAWVADFVDGVAPEDHYPRPASAPPEASGLRGAAEALVALHIRDLNPTLHPFDSCLVCALRSALAATPDARPDPREERAERAEREYRDAADMFARVVRSAGGEVLVSWEALLVTPPRLMRAEDPKRGGIVFVTEPLAALPASPQATTPAPAESTCHAPGDYWRCDKCPAPSHDAKENDHG